MSCGCKGSNQSAGCGCQKTSSSAGAMPFYASNCECQEDHTTHIIEPRYATTIVNGSAFNMPACNAQATMSIPGLATFLVGAYLWNPTYGYLKVVGANPVNETVTVENTCLAGNAAPGTEIPLCTYFIIVDVPSVGAAPAGACAIYPYVAVDFTVPAANDCIPITVSNVNGLVAGKSVQIDGCLYTLSAILGATLIEVCNTGAAIPGTVVYALDGAGNCITPVVLIDVNPCTNDQVGSGALVVCSGGIMTTLKPNVIGQIPVAVDTDGTVQYQTIAVDTAPCTTLTPAGVSLIHDTYQYTIPVGDSTWMTAGMILHIDGFPTYTFTVISTPDDTHALVEVYPNPAAPGPTDIPCDTVLCAFSCCEQLANDIYGYAFLTTTGWQYRNTNPVTKTAPLPAGPALVGSDITALITNTGSRRKLVTVEFQAAIEGTFNIAAAGKYATWNWELKSNSADQVLGDVTPITTGAATWKIENSLYINNGATLSAPMSELRTWTERFEVDPGRQLRIAMAMSFYIYAGSVDDFSMGSSATFGGMKSTMDVSVLAI